ncbi:hypothetical protein MRB53_034738 [Persea americana]|uniref:Uncharacterized protein n=1 Tax=Persea americana TaxID=3435 RepID=A0ACC2K2R8_PERAE|nr:hypothetical protein MRB53_034738 [Persea americana]
MAAVEAHVDFEAAIAENNDAEKPKNNKGGSKKGKKKKNGDGGSPHRACDCPKEKPNALVAEEEQKQEETSRVNPVGSR